MKKIGRYEVIGLLGQGGMGRVYKVRLPAIGRILALKQLAPAPHLIKLLGEAEVRRRFVREAEIMAGVRHPHLLEVWDFDQDGGRPFFVMEYFCRDVGLVIGEAVRLEDPTRVVPFARAVKYLSQTLEGLGRLHRAGIVHRDLKPSNLLLDDRDEIKIGDFGLSRLKGEARRGPSHLKIGSPYYAAPEQVRDPAGAGPAADLYSVGVVAHRLLTGLLPEQAEQPSSRLSPDLDEDWDFFFRRALAEDPAGRFGGAAEMLVALNALEAVWQARQEQICALAEAGASRPAAEPPRTALRSAPMKIGFKNARETLRLDALWRPARYHAHDFVPGPNGVVPDRATGLTWQQSGSEDPLAWPEAKTYVAGLNQARFAGRASWRLPTVEELISLLDATPHGVDFCLAPVFDPRQRWLWSADWRTFTAAYFVSADMGFAAWQDMTCAHFVRAVSSG
jgi:serine/threonine-protein kinase